MPSSWSSVLAPAMGALLQAWQTWPELGLAGVDVRDGPQAPDTSQIQAVWVGWSGPPAPGSLAAATENSADLTAVSEGLGGHRDRVKGPIHCCAAYVDESENPATARIGVEALVNACGQAVDVDRTLNGTVMRAIVSVQGLRTEPVMQGIRAWQLFDVEIDAYTAG